MKHRNDSYIGRLHLFVRIVFVLSVIFLTAAFAVQFSYAKDDDSVNLYLDIGFNSNMLLNKYDVSFEVDGEQLDTVEYGLYYTKLCKVEPGEHVIRVYKDDEHDVKGEEKITVNEDTTFQCLLKTKRKEIELEEAITFKGTAGHSIEMPACVGVHLVDALALLKQKGFINYHFKSDREETIEEETWAVDIQNIKAGKKTDKNEEIILTCIPAKEYVEKTFPGMTYSKAIKKAEAIGYKNIKKHDARSKKQPELKEDEISKKTRKYWTVKSAEDQYSDDSTIVLSFVYNVPMPDLVGTSAKKADGKMEAIQQDHFYYSFVGYKTGNSISYKDLKNYNIVKQSEKPGTIIKYNSSITFKCKKTEAAREKERQAKLAAKAKAEREAQEEIERKLNIAVWYTNTGDCYHLEGCRYLRSMKGPITQREAIKQRLGPCSECIDAWAYIQDWTQYR